MGRSKSKVKRSERVTIGLYLDDYQVLKEIEKLGGSRVSKTISELVEQAMPTFRMILRQLEVVKKLEDSSKEELKKMVETVSPNFVALTEQAETLVDEATSQLDLFFQGIGKVSEKK